MKFMLPFAPHHLAAWTAQLLDQAAATPYSHLDGYMQRWFLSPEDRASYHLNGPVRRLHKILRSDNERDLHDHPFDYTTIILAGGYLEETPLSPSVPNGPRRSQWHGPGSVLVRRAEDLHRLVLPEGQTCTTLFITSPRRREWGFHTPTGWVDWRSYLNIPPHLNSALQPITESA